MLTRRNLGTVSTLVIGRFAVNCARSVVDLVCEHYRDWPGPAYLRLVERSLAKPYYELRHRLPGPQTAFGRWHDGERWESAFYPEWDGLDLTRRRSFEALAQACMAQEVVLLPARLTEPSSANTTVEVALRVARAARMSLDLRTLDIDRPGCTKWPVAIQHSPAFYGQVADLARLLRLKKLSADEQAILVGLLAGFLGTFQEAVRVARRIAARKPTPQERAAVEMGINRGTLESARRLGISPEQCIETAQDANGLLEWMVGRAVMGGPVDASPSDWRVLLELPTAPVKGTNVLVETGVRGLCRVEAVHDEEEPSRRAWYFPDDELTELRADHFVFIGDGPHDHWVVTEVLGYDATVQESEVACGFYRGEGWTETFAATLELAKQTFRTDPVPSAYDLAAAAARS